MPLPAFSSPSEDKGESLVPKAFRTTLELLIPIPRLVTLVRACLAERQDGLFLSCVRALEQIAQALCSCEDQIEAAIDNFGTLCPNQDKASENILPTVTTFLSKSCFDLALHYFTLRLLLCGLFDTIQREDRSILGDLKKSREHLSREGSFARRVMMCIQYAMTEHKSDAFVGLRLMVPLKHAYGSLVRVHQRQQGGEDDTTELNLLKQYCYDTRCAIMSLWGANELPSQAFLQSCCDTAAGYELESVPFVDAPESSNPMSYARWIFKRK